MARGKAFGVVESAGRRRFRRDARGIPHRRPAACPVTGAPPGKATVGLAPGAVSGFLSRNPDGFPADGGLPDVANDPCERLPAALSRDHGGACAGIRYGPGRNEAPASGGDAEGAERACASSPSPCALSNCRQFGRIRKCPAHRPAMWSNAGRNRGFDRISPDPGTGRRNLSAGSVRRSRVVVRVRAASSASDCARWGCSGRPGSRQSAFRPWRLACPSGSRGRIPPAPEHRPDA